MTLKDVAGTICGYTAIGGAAVMKWVFARKAARARGVSTMYAMANFDWVRDERGHFRWIVPIWLVFWFLAAALTRRG